MPYDILNIKVKRFCMEHRKTFSHDPANFLGGNGTVKMDTILLRQIFQDLSVLHTGVHIQIGIDTGNC